MASGPTRIAQAGIDVMFAPIGNLTNVFENDITLFGIWHNKVFDLTHINGASTYPGERVNLPQGARQPTPGCASTCPAYGAGCRRWNGVT